MSVQPLGETAAPLDLNILRKAKEEDKLVTWSMDQFRKIKNSRGPIERQWYLNMAFYLGKQNVSVMSTTSATGNNFRLHVPDAPPWRVRLISNKIRPMLRTELAKVTAQKPTAMIVPASDDDQDIFAARAGEELWESTYRRKKVKSVMRKAMYWTLITGTGFTKQWWDNQARNLDWPIPGDFEIEAETPFHIFVPDFREEELESQPYLIHASTKSPEWVRMRYKGDFNPNTAAAKDLLDDAFINMVGADQVQKDAVLCLEVWAKPGALASHPDGVMFTVIGDKIVQATEGLPYQHGQYPFSKFTHIPTGRFYAESTITDLIPLQKEYNRTRSQIIEAKNRMAKPQLIAPRGSVDPKLMTTEPGQVILYTPGFQPPSPLPLQSLPPYVLEELNRVQMDMDDISGQHEVTKGRVPPGVTAATAISYLQEQDDSKLSHTIDSIEEGVEKMASQVLSYVVQYWEAERIIKVVGNDRSFDALTLKGSDLRGNTDLRVEAGSALPQSKAAKQAFIMDLMKMGFITPDKGLQVLEIGGIDKLYDDIQTDMRQAQRENLRLQQGQPVACNTWDNHAIHIEVHNKFRKGQSFEMLPPEIKALFEQHVLMHQAVSMGMNPAMAGQPPVAGPPAPPGADPAALPPGAGPGPEQQPNEGI